MNKMDLTIKQIKSEVTDTEHLINILLEKLEQKTGVEISYIRFNRKKHPEVRVICENVLG